MLRLYNSRNNTIEEFSHSPNIPINMYICGPTVYSEVHLGNLKTFLLGDFIVGFLNKIGYTTNHIINVTDIDDKIINRIPEQTLPALLEFTNFYTQKLLEDMDKL